jgi:hypothetical protein
MRWPEFSAPILTLALALPALGQTAQLQVIHNSADPSAARVDVYVNDALLLDDFAFRSATPFVEVPAEVELRVGVAPAGSQGAADILARFPLTLRSNGRYVAVAAGVLDAAAFAANPDGAPTGFRLFALEGVPARAPLGFVALRAFHGATDAPAVDIRGAGLGAVAADLSFGEFSAPRWLLPRRYTLDVTPAGDANTVVASFDADLRSLAGGAAVVFASGYLNPLANQDGAAFGLFAALADGSVLELPKLEPTAMLQIIHNAADPAAAVVDVYVNGNRLLDDFAFRSATPFVEVPAEVDLAIGVAPRTSGSAADVLATFDVSLARGGRYVVMANGVLDPGAFAANPGGAAIGFSLYPRGQVPDRSFASLVTTLGFHGATDAPAVDVYARAWRFWVPVFRGLSYGEFEDRRLLARDTQLAITPAGDRRTVVAFFDAPLSQLRNQAVTVFASGFLDPAANAGGAAFGLFVALADGTVLPLPRAAAKDLRIELEGETDLPVAASAEFRLLQNAPNPFNPATSIRFNLPSAMDVRLEVYDLRGRLVSTLVDGTLSAGPHEVTFRGEELASGVYMYRLSAGDRVETRRMNLVK